VKVDGLELDSSLFIAAYYIGSNKEQSSKRLAEVVGSTPTRSISFCEGITALN